MRKREEFSWRIPSLQTGEGDLWRTEEVQRPHTTDGGLIPDEQVIFLFMDLMELFMAVKKWHVHVFVFHPVPLIII